MSYLAQRNISGDAEGRRSTSDELRIVSLPRYLLENEFGEWRDVDALEKDWPHGTLCDGCVQEISIVEGDMPGGVVVGEGDTGKTWYADRLAALSTDEHRVRIFRLREYVRDSDGLRTEVNAFVDETASCRARTVVFDGLDENPESVGVILRFCRAHLREHGTVHVWITSRQIKEVDLLVGSDSLLQTYRLMPFLSPDIEVLANGAGLNGEAFVRELDRLGLMTLASKPGGAVLLMSLFRSGRLSDDLEAILNDVVKSFAGARRDGKKIPETEAKVSELKILEAAAWTATRLCLGERNSIWDGDPTDCPSEALPFRELERGVFTYDILSELLKRRLFEPLDPNRYRFVSDEMLVPFLTAKWLHDKGGPCVEDLFETKLGMGATLRAVLPWLARFEPDRAGEWIPHAPQSFLVCSEAIDAYGADRFYKALKEDFLRLSWDDRFAFYVTAGKTLSDLDELGEYALARLGSPRTSVVEACLAATLAARTVDAGRAIDGLVEVFVSRSLGVEERCRVLQVLDRIAQKSRPPSLDRLKPFLMSRNKADRDRDGALGCYLALLQEHLSAREMAEWLIKPWRWDCDERLKQFLSGGPGQLDVKSFCRRDVVINLRWAAEAWRSWRRDETLRELAMRIFAHAWAWAEEESVADAFADFMDAAISVVKPHDVSIFSEILDVDGLVKDGLSLGSWLDDQSRRFAILRVWLARQDHLREDTLSYVVSADHECAVLVYVDEYEALRETSAGWTDRQGGRTALDELSAYLVSLLDAERRLASADGEGPELFRLTDVHKISSDLCESLLEKRIESSEGSEERKAEEYRRLADLRGADPVKAEEAFDALMNANDHSAQVEIGLFLLMTEVTKLARMYLWMHRRFAAAALPCDSDLQFNFPANEGARTLCSIITRLVGEPPAAALAILREDLKTHPDDDELKDLCLTVERRLVDRLPPKLVHPELLDVWAGVPGVAVSRAGMSKGTASRVGRNSEHTRIQLRAVKRYLDKTKPRQWSVDDITIQVVSHLWKLNRSEWDAWKRDKTGFASIESLHQGVKRRFIEGKL